MKPSVYLAGPITGESYAGATDWRTFVSQQLSPEIDSFSPLRSKVWLQGVTTIKDTHDEHVMSSQRGIYARDHHDCRERDLIFVNLLNAKKVSIGTVMEIAWAAAYNKPVVLVMESTDNIHEHAMLREACPLRVDTLEEGIYITRSLLLPG